jgi:hypothetical protein
MSFSPLNCCRVSDHAAQKNPYRELAVPDPLEAEIFEHTAYVIVQSQQLTRERISRVLIEIKQTLRSFDDQD